MPQTSQKCDAFVTLSEITRQYVHFETLFVPISPFLRDSGILAKSIWKKWPAAIFEFDLLACLYSKPMKRLIVAFCFLIQKTKQSKAKDTTHSVLIYCNLYNSQMLYVRDFNIHLYTF